MNRPILAIVAVTAVGVMLLPAPTLAGNGQAQKESRATEGRQAAAALHEKAVKTYSVDCAICHGENGNGKTDVATSMNLTLGDWTNPATLANKTDQELFTIIRNGKDKMPAEVESRAKDDEVKVLIAYIRGMSKAHHEAAPAEPAATETAPQ